MPATMYGSMAAIYDACQVLCGTMCTWALVPTWWSNHNFANHIPRKTCYNLQYIITSFQPLPAELVNRLKRKVIFLENFLFVCLLLVASMLRITTGIDARLWKRTVVSVLIISMLDMRIHGQGELFTKLWEAHIVFCYFWDRSLILLALVSISDGCCCETWPAVILLALVSISDGCCCEACPAVILLALVSISDGCCCEAFQLLVSISDGCCCEACPTVILLALVSISDGCCCEACPTVILLALVSMSDGCCCEAVQQWCWALVSISDGCCCEACPTVILSSSKHLWWMLLWSLSSSDTVSSGKHLWWMLLWSLSSSDTVSSGKHLWWMLLWSLASSDTVSSGKHLWWMLLWSLSSRYC